MSLTPQEDDQPKLAIRRHHDRCFHPVEEVVPEGYIVQGVLIDRDEVAQVVELAGDGSAAVPACQPFQNFRPPLPPSSRVSPADK